MSFFRRTYNFNGATFVAAPDGHFGVIVAKWNRRIEHVARCPTLDIARDLRSLISGAPLTGAPTLIEVIPATIVNDAWTKGYQNIIVAGTNFRDGATVALTGSGLSMTFLSRATSGYANDILWTTWQSGNLTPGTYPADYSDPYGNSVTLTNAFVVT